MGFGRRVGATIGGTIERARGVHGRRPMLRTAVAGLILGFGGVTAGTGLVQASERGGLFDFFGAIFGVPQAHRVERPRTDPRQVRRYASLPHADRIASLRPRALTPRPGHAAAPTPYRGRISSPMVARGTTGAPRAGVLSVCVRTCDGYLFPLGTLRAPADRPLHQAACAMACPNAATALYALPPGRDELSQAVDEHGRPYLAAAWANVYRQRRVENCRCREPGVAAAPPSIDGDPTVRVGDVVATADSAEVVTRLARGDVTTEDYRTSRGLTRRDRRAVDLRVGALRRAADDRAFRRTLRAGTGPVRFAELRSTRLRLDAAEPAGPSARTAAAAPGFAPVRVLVPSPYEP